MSDLISRTALIKDISYIFGADSQITERVVEQINRQPVAYDLEKVIKNLELECTKNSRHELHRGHYKITTAERAEKIVRSGGKE